LWTTVEFNPESTYTNFSGTIHLNKDVVFDIMYKWLDKEQFTRIYTNSGILDLKLPIDVNDKEECYKRMVEGWSSMIGDAINFVSACDGECVVFQVQLPTSSMNIEDITDWMLLNETFFVEQVSPLLQMIILQLADLQFGNLMENKQ